MSTRASLRRLSLINLVAIGLSVLVGFVAYWLIVFVDPYNVRGGLLPQKLAEHRYPQLEWPLLIDQAASTPHELVLMGGSTSMRITPEMLTDVFPQYSHPINLSYIAPRPIDMGQHLEKILGIESLHRIILVMDFSLMERRSLMSAAGDTNKNIHSTSWSHAGDFSLLTAGASFNRIIFGTYSLPSWAKLTQPEFMDGAVPVLNSIKSMKQIRYSIAKHKLDAFAKSSLTCEMIPFVKKELEVFLKKAIEKNIRVDLVYPPYPYVLYYNWIDYGPRLGILQAGPIFDQFTTFKSCVVKEVDELHSDIISIHVIDNVPEISGNLMRYLDVGHLIDTSAYVESLKMISSGNYKSNSSNFDTYIKKLRENVEQSAKKFY